MPAFLQPVKRLDPGRSWVDRLREPSRPSLIQAQLTIESQRAPVDVQGVDLEQFNGLPSLAHPRGAKYLFGADLLRGVTRPKWEPCNDVCRGIVEKRFASILGTEGKGTLAPLPSTIAYNERWLAQ